MMDNQQSNQLNWLITCNLYQSLEHIWRYDFKPIIIKIIIIIMPWPLYFMALLQLTFVLLGSKYSIEIIRIVKGL